jgi:predicted DNA repair protein MutK
VLTVVAIVMTVGVMPSPASSSHDAGWHYWRPGAPARRAGALLLAAAPWLMRVLAVVGTAAMFLVGGGILAHGLPWLHHTVDAVAAAVPQGAGLITLLANGLVGVVAGALLVIALRGIGALRQRVSDKR